MNPVLQSFFCLVRKPTLFLLLTLLRGYRLFISPWLPSCCRFQPSCSAYAIEALQVHGIFRGSFFTLRRLLRCHPWSKHEHYDPIPKKELN